MRSKLKKALRLIRKGKNEIVNLITLLVNSVEPRSLYPPIRTVQMVERWLESKKISFETIEFVQGFRNIVIKIGEQPEDGVVFLGHLDVVSPGDIVKWTHNPFRATRAGNRIYGRGTCDMKGGVAAMLVGESRSQSRSKDVVRECLAHPLLEVDLRGAKGALIPVSYTHLTLPTTERV